MANIVPVSKGLLANKQKTPIIKSSKLLNLKPKSLATASGNQELPTNILLGIEKKVIKIDKLLKNSLLISKKEGEKKRKGEEQKEFGQREKELEKKKPEKVKGLNLPSPPKMGFLDWIKNFVTQTIFGFLFLRLYDFFPKLLKLFPLIIKVTDFITDVGGKMLDGLITFVDWGYKAIDGTRKFVKQLGGEGLSQNFDKFAGAIDNLIEVAIITALVTADSGGFGGGKPGAQGKPGAPGKPGTPYKYDRLGGAVQKNYGHAGRQIYQNARLNGKTHKQALEAVRRAVRQGRIVGAPQTGSLGGADAGSKIFGRGIARAPQRLATKALVGTLGKGGAKAVLKFVKPLVSRIPIIGGLIEFGLSWALGEPVGKAAFRGIGAVLVGAIGTAIGGPIGAFLGSWAGGEAGGLLYDMFFGNKKPKGKTVKAAGGGKPATRGGQPVSGRAKRTVKKKKVPRTLRATPSALKPGKSIGGEKQIQKIYPESKDKTKMSPFNFLENSYETFSRSSGLGALAALAIKPIMGDKPTYADYKNAGTGVNNWMNQSIASGTLAYAGGGEVKMESIVSGEDYSNVIAKSLQDSVAPQADKIIQDLMKQLMLKKSEPEIKEKEPTGEPTTPEGIPLDEGSTASGRSLMQGLIQRGFTKEEASAIVGNLWAESGFRTNATNPTSGAFGLMQWLSGRKSRLYSYAAEKGKSVTDTNLQLDYIKWELKGGNAYETAQFQKAMAYGPSVAEKTKGFAYEVERASPGELSRSMSKRVGAAESVYGGRMVAGETPSLSYTGGGTGSGYGSGGVKIAGDLGDFLKSNRGKIGVTGSIHQHPRHPGQFRRGYFSYHNQNRALDIGGYGPNHPSSGGRDEQAPVIRALLEWNKKNGYKPVEIIHGSPAFRGLGKYESAPNALHSNHVHVAYSKGGKTKGVPHFSMLGEEGPEFVIDADSTAALEQNYPGFLDRLNKAKYKEAVRVLQSYVEYERPEPEIVYVKVPVEVPVPVPMGGGSTMIVGGIDSEGPDFSTLAMV